MTLVSGRALIAHLYEEIIVTLAGSNEGMKGPYSTTAWDDALKCEMTFPSNGRPLRTFLLYTKRGRSYIGSQGSFEM